MFEIKKPILPNPTDYKVTFNLPAPLPAGTPGSIVRSSTPFNATSLPFALFTLNKCSVLSFHFHPLGNEQLFIIKGKACAHLHTRTHKTQAFVLRSLKAMQRELLT